MYMTATNSEVIAVVAVSWDRPSHSAGAGVEEDGQVIGSSWWQGYLHPVTPPPLWSNTSVYTSATNVCRSSTCVCMHACVCVVYVSVHACMCVRELLIYAMWCIPYLAAACRWLQTECGISGRVPLQGEVLPSTVDYLSVHKGRHACLPACLPAPRPSYRVGDRSISPTTYSVSVSV